MTTDTLTAKLEEMLDEPVASVAARERRELDSLLDESGGRVVLFGAGSLGQQTLRCLRASGIEPLAFSDNNPRIWDTQIDGVQVLRPESAAARFGGDAVFIVTIWNASHWFSETCMRLQALGCRRVAPPSPVYWRFAEAFLPFYTQDLPHRVYEQSRDVLEAATIWSDDWSKEEYLRQVAWRARGAWTFRRPECTDSYFLPDVFSSIPEEVFIDCGAFDGDTLRAYLAYCGQRFRRYVAIEPDAISFRRLEAFAAGLDASVQGRLKLLHSAVGAERATISFNDGGGLDSRAAAEGSSLVPSIPISDLAESSMPITFIKMDIEGAELDALRGARPVIEHHRPILAVCVYHSQHDLWQLPLLMKEMLPAYLMFLRCHEGDGWQTVAYAVPPERALSGSTS